MVLGLRYFGIVHITFDIVLHLLRSCRHSRIVRQIADNTGRVHLESHMGHIRTTYAHFPEAGGSGPPSMLAPTAAACRAASLARSVPFDLGL